MDRRVTGSFRDPKGFVFTRDGIVFRQINNSYRDDYEHLMRSGLYADLEKRGLLVAHEEVAGGETDADRFKTIKPEQIPFVSYPYEWSFGQLKTAALRTLEIQQRALDCSMVLKDASAFNIQFARGRAVLIDTLSFERYREGLPWVAYRQFCQHFLAPLALMCCRDVRLSQLFRIYIDGLPLDLASSLLPWHSYLRFSLLTHIHLHARSQTAFAGSHRQTRTGRVSKRALLGLVDSLVGAISRLEWGAGETTEWGSYSSEESYSAAGVEDKKRLVGEYLRRLKPRVVWDFGGNVGLYSRIGSGDRELTISFDVDPLAVERNYRQTVEQREGNILPLLLDLTNPSPGIGWDNTERVGIQGRGSADTIMALAVIHHLAISNNVPLRHIASYLSRICRSLVIEFVPRSDPQVRRLLVNREDVFQDYTEAKFASAFEEFFETEDVAHILDSERVLYMMRKKST